MNMSDDAKRQYADLEYRTSIYQSRMLFFRNERMKMSGIIALLVICFFTVGFASKLNGNKFFPIDGNNHFKRYISPSVPLGTLEQRQAHAAWLVTNINSLTYVDKDKTLSNLEMYFDAQVFKEYIIKQYTVGHFEEMMRHSLSYHAIVEPGIESENEDLAVLYSDKRCYGLDKYNPKCRFLKVGINHSETYVFDVERLMNLPSGDVRQQLFKVRITLTRTDVTTSSFPYMVSEYTEIIS